MMQTLLICSDCSVDLRPHARYCDNCGRLQPRSAGTYSDASMSLGPISCRTLRQTVPVISEAVPGPPQLPLTCEVCTGPATDAQELCASCGNYVTARKLTLPLALRYVGRVFRRIASVSGRAPRQEFWSYALFTTVATAVSVFIGVGLPDGPISGAYLAAFCVMIAVFVVANTTLTIRRLHDTGRSGMLVLWMFVPLIGSIVLSAFCAGRSTAAGARFGPPEPLR